VRRTLNNERRDEKEKKNEEHGAEF